MNKLNQAYSLAREIIYKQTGKRHHKHSTMLAAIHELTGCEYTGGDVCEYLMTFARQATPQATPQAVSYAPSQVKQYTPDTAMRLASARARTQPELISMNSNIRIWTEKGDR